MRRLGTADTRLSELWAVGCFFSPFSLQEKKKQTLTAIGLCWYIKALKYRSVEQTKVCFLTGFKYLMDYYQSFPAFPKSLFVLAAAPACRAVSSVARPTVAR